MSTVPEVSVLLELGSLVLCLTCDISQVGAVRRITGRNLLIGENVMAAITDENLCQILEALTGKPEALIREHMVSVEIMQKAILAIASVLLNNGKPIDISGASAKEELKNPSQPT